MISRDELRRMAARRKLNLGFLEKEYVLDLVLRSISADDELHQALVLKGGTALHKFYAAGRLSLDLDFTANRPVTIDELRPSVEVAEIDAVIAEHRTFHDALTITRLRYLGPLRYANSIKLDVSFREPVLLSPVDLAAESAFGDPFSVRVMQVAEIAAEKLRALSMRQTPRDVYDLWVIATRHLAAIPQIAQLTPHKLQAVGIAFDPTSIADHLAAVERVWKTDLAGLMVNVPEYSEVRQRLDPWLQEIFDAAFQ